MKYLTLIVTFLAFGASGALMSLSQSGQKSPKEVVEEFCRFETAGERLTPEGWNKAERFFRRSVPPPKNKTILVTAKNYSVWDPVFRTEDRADVIVGVTGSIWKIDSNMAFSQYSSPNEVKSSFFYTVVRDNKRSESGSNARDSQGVTGTPEWKIEGAGENIWLTADTAIRYVTQVRDRTSDAVVKQNAEKTVIKLKQFLR